MKLVDHIRWPMMGVLVAVAVVLLAVAGSAGAASSGASAAQNLGQAGSVVGGLSGSVGTNGAYGSQNPNAGSVPFLGGAPGSLVSNVFSELGPLSGFNNFSPGDEDLVRVVADKVDAIDSALGGNKLTGTYTCGSSPCVPDTDKVKDLTSIELNLSHSGSQSGEIDFTSLGLPSLGFLPNDAQKIKVDLSWSVNVRLITDGSGLRLAPAQGDVPELTLGATLTLPTNSFKVDLGALVVKATTITQPQFSGSLLVNLNDQGGFSFGFGPDSGFKAGWHLETEDSPLMGVSGNLNITWPLTDSGVNAGGLRIAVDNITIETDGFLGGIQDAAAAIREVSHPIRTVTSPMIEPIPGLSDISSAIGGGDVTMLKLMEAHPDFPPEVREALEKLRLVDDVVSALAGDGNEAELGSFTLIGSDALEPKDQPFGAAVADKIKADLQNVVDKCAICKQKVNEFLGSVNGTAPGDGGFQFEMPVLREPASMAGLLLGRDVELITFDTGKLGYADTLNLPIARFFIFSVALKGPIDASLHLKGGVDTRGIADALRSGDAADVLNGVYLQNPTNNDALVTLKSEVKLSLSADIFVAGVSINGGPDLHVLLRVPESAPQGKLRPAIVKDGIGCALLESDGARADFGVLVTATFDYLIDDYTDTLAQHTFFTKQDLCNKDAELNVPIAEPEGNILVINNATKRGGVKPEDPDSVKVFMRHDPSTGAPESIVVTVNDNRHKDFPAADFVGIRYAWPDDPRNVNLRVVKNDDKAFEKKVFVETGTGDDDVLVDSTEFGFVRVNEGHDKVIVTAGGAAVSGGPGDDYVAGGDNLDILNGGEGIDTVSGGGAFDILSGEAGNDLLLDSSPSNNCLSGGPDNDQIIDGPGADFLNGDEAFCGANSTPHPEEDGTSAGNDVIITGGGSDIVVAGNGKDEVKLDKSGVFGPNDESWKANVRVQGNGGNDDIRTGNGADVVHAGSGDDEAVTDGGPRDALAFRNGGADTVHGGLGKDRLFAGDANDIVFGDNGIDSCTPPITGQPAEADTVGSDDQVEGGDGADQIALEAGADKALGLNGDDTICGHAGNDDIDGGDDNDTAFGGTGMDAVKGGSDDDELFGNAGTDTMNGGDDADRLVGGSSAAGTPDTDDTINGDGGVDVIVGDNGAISDALPRVPSVFDLFAGDATFGGADTIGGGADGDRAFGGIAGDTIRGGDGDDHLEGNNGDDAVHGEGDQDDVIGGTSPEALPSPAADKAAADAPDAGETILSGGAERDVILGDNGIITRPGGTDPIIGGVARAVTLLDRNRTGAALAAVSGGDYIEGNDERDRLYGEGGADYMKGNDSDDFAEGNQNADRLEGNDGEDDLIGGSSFASSPGVGDPDAGDQLAGGANADVLLGDNAAITRATTGSGSGFDWDTVASNWLGHSARRSITFLDKAALNPANFGADVLSGGAGDDVAFGQDGSDLLYGGSHDDSLEGNGGSDVIYGDQVAPATGHPHESGQPQLDGVPGPDGQDDEIGGSSLMKATAGNGAVTGQRDAGDELHGDGNADVQLGDNGKVLRRIVNGSYQTYQAVTGKPTIVRQAASTGSPATALPARFDVGAAAAAGLWGDDTLYGDGGDDVQLAEDGNDQLYGGAGDDDQYGELGNDRIFGETGEDAMLGDRGVVANALVTTPGATFSVTGVPKISFTPYAAHPLDRRVDMNDDGDGTPLESPGMTTGGVDFMRGGPDHDAMHGEAGGDLMNGDSGGDYLFGDDGVDVMWGGKGKECADPANSACHTDHGANDSYLDYLFGGRGLQTDPVTGGADLLDFRPRPGIDPAPWFEITSTNGADPVADHQHHQGVDWIYGGWDRDVMQADLTANGPNDGDRLIDWNGSYNLYVHCGPANGGHNIIRQHSPNMQAFLQKLAYHLGAGKSLTDVQTKGTSGYNELALVYNTDANENSGNAYPGTPGHFEQFSCAP